MELRNRTTVAFKSEDSLWHQLAYGTRKVDMREDNGEARIVVLKQGMQGNEDDRVPFSLAPGLPGNHTWRPDVDAVVFENKLTGETVTLEYRGPAFVPFATGWIFLLLGAVLDRTPPTSTQNDTSDEASGKPPAAADMKLEA